MSVNTAILVGRVGQDPEVKYLEGGTCVANFSLATNEKYKNKQGEQIEKTEWHKVVIWRKLAEVVEKYVKKGDQIYLRGKIRNRSYNDKDGITRYTTEIYVEELTMLGGKSSNDEKFKQQAEAAGVNDQEKPTGDAVSDGANEPVNDVLDGDLPDEEKDGLPF